jgi:hypothetical protein
VVGGKAQSGLTGRLQEPVLDLDRIPDELAQHLAQALHAVPQARPSAAQLAHRLDASTPEASHGSEHETGDPTVRTAPG